MISIKDIPSVVAVVIVVVLLIGFAGCTVGEARLASTRSSSLGSLSLSQQNRPSIDCGTTIEGKEWPAKIFLTSADPITYKSCHGFGVIIKKVDTLFDCQNNAIHGAWEQGKEVGIVLQADHVRVLNCHISTFPVGISIQYLGDSNVITKNIISDVDTGIVINSDSKIAGTRITKNRFSTYRKGVILGSWMENTRIFLNDFYGGGIGRSDDDTRYCSDDNVGNYLHYDELFPSEQNPYYPP